jgi:ribosomal protein S18 acetylase RimI-like enzyme
LLVTDVVVRPARAGDTPVMGRLGAALVALHHDFDPDRFIAATPSTAREYGAFLARELKRAEVIMLVAEGSEGVLGYTYAAVEGTDYMALRGPAGALYDLVVDPRHRRQAVGRRLLDATIAALIERGAPRVVISTAERNAAAQDLFAAAGFRRTMIEMTRELR